MTTIRGPLITLTAAAALGGGILLVNTMQGPDAPPPRPAVQVTAAPAPAAPAPAATPEVFAPKAEYVGEIPTAKSILRLDMRVDGGEATAYACDNVGIESWLSGPAVDGAVRLSGTDGARLDGRLRNGAVVGTLWIGDKSWDFTAPNTSMPAYRYQGGGDE